MKTIPLRVCAGIVAAAGVLIAALFSMRHETSPTPSRGRDAGQPVTGTSSKMSSGEIGRNVSAKNVQHRTRSAEHRCQDVQLSPTLNVQGSMSDVRLSQRLVPSCVAAAGSVTNGASASVAQASSLRPPSVKREVVPDDETVDAAVDLTAPERRDELGEPRHPCVERAAELARRGNAEDVVELVELSDRAASEGMRDDVLLEIEGASNPAGRAVLLDVMNIGDQGLVDASQAALAKQGDDLWAGEIAAAYESESNAEAQARVADVLRYVRSPSAGSNLLALAANLDEGEGGADALWCAAVEAMGNVGSAQVVTPLVQRLGQTASAVSLPAYDAMLGALSRVDNPESRPLLVAMVEAGLAGELTADLYWAAVRALRFHPDEKTRTLLEKVAQTDDATTRATAQSSLRVMSRLARR